MIEKNHRHHRRYRCCPPFLVEGLKNKASKNKYNEVVSNDGVRFKNSF
jgi:hypothetical protein